MFTWYSYVSTLNASVMFHLLKEAWFQQGPQYQLNITVLIYSFALGICIYGKMQYFNCNYVNVTIAQYITIALTHM